MHYRVMIIGSGPAGLTAALYAARANLGPVVVRGLQPGGLIATTDEVENYPGFPDAVNGFDLATKMEQQATRFGTTYIDGLVEQVDASERPFRVTLDSGETHTTDTLIVATGASPRKLGVPGELELANRGVSYCAVCDGFFFRDKRIVVVGGGNSAVEEGLFLTRFASEVVIVHRRDQLRADPIIQQRAFNHPKVRFIWDTVVTAITGETKVSGVTLENVKTGETSTLDAEAVFPYVGHIPNTAIFKGVLDMDENGYILSPGRTRTNVAGLFAAGDVVDHVYRQAITAAAEGCQAAMEASWYIDSLDAQDAPGETVGEALGQW